jgi:hypothetical protein
MRRWIAERDLKRALDFARSHSKLEYLRRHFHLAVV